MDKLTIRDFDLEGKTIFARLDWNVPVIDGRIEDTARIEATRPTVEYLIKKNCRVIIASHLGRPDGQSKSEFSLGPVAKAAAKVLGRPVGFVADCVGPEVEAAAKALKPGELLCLENVRFHPEEEANDPKFAKQLAADSGAEVFVYDAFASYRPHASTEGIAHVLPGVAGLLVELEVNHITGAIEHPNRPLIAVIGGAKVSTKLPVIENLIPKVDAMLLTGPIANTFAKAHGLSVGKSVVEAGMEGEIHKLEKIAKDANTQLLLPGEVMVSTGIEKASHLHAVKLGDVQSGEYIVDAAPSYALQLSTEVFEFLDFDNKCTVIWNGPLGLTEVEDFRAGSRAMAEAIIKLPGCTSIVGGGDTTAYVDEAGLRDKFTWVSTGGGASLELMSGKGLPCVNALQHKP
jgi:phosphoglycerate kinase